MFGWSLEIGEGWFVRGKRLEIVVVLERIVKVGDV